MSDTRQDDRPQLLVVSDLYPWPADNGDKLRLGDALRGLAREFTLDLMCYGEATVDPGDPVHSWCRQITLRPRPTQRPGRAAYLRAWLELRAPSYLARRHTDDMVAAIRERTARTDYAGVLAYGPPGGLLVLRARVAGPVVYDAIDAVYPVLYDQYRFVPSSKAKALSLADLVVARAFERRLLNRCCLSLTTAQHEAEALRALNRRASVAVVLPGLALSEYEVVPQSEESAGAMALVGSWSYFANRDAARRLCTSLMPRVLARHPEAKLHLVGGGAKHIAHLQSESIQVHGWVADPREYMRPAQVLPMPYRYGGGVKMKLLEALAMGKAAVVSPRAVKSMPFESFGAVAVARSDDEFCQSISEVLADAGRRRELGEAGRRSIEAHFDGTRTGAQYAALIQSALVN